MQDEIVRKLDVLIATIKTTSLPQNYRWLDAEDVGVMLGFSARQVLERLAIRDDFPAPMRVDGTGHPRWSITEINDWAKKHKMK
jgi:predicted DNA-binding transcriptional regulator AlpA